MVYSVMYHGLCLLTLIMVYYDFRGKQKRLASSLEAVFIMTALIILSDCGWTVMGWTGFKPTLLCYAVNILYYVAEICDVYAWTQYTLGWMNSRLYANRKRQFLIALPAAVIVLLSLSTFVTGVFFTIENGEYVRGDLFYLDVAAKLGYLVFCSVYTFVHAQREQKKYMKTRLYVLGSFCFPVLVGGILQSAFGLDFNCICPVLSLSIVYRFGLSNDMKEKSSLLRSVSQAYMATFVIDVDSHTVRPMSASEEYSHISEAAGTTLYEKCLLLSIREHVLPEYRTEVEKSFSIPNLLVQLEEKGIYSVLYKVRTSNGRERFNKATFIKAFAEDGHREIILGIEKVETRQLLMQRREVLENEREDFERVKESLTTVLANVIEARDADSGEHVFRVKDYTQLLCNRVMSDCPEYGLTPLKIRHIVQGSALHDIGKIMIPDAILLKPGRLTAEEFAIMKTHCMRGCDVLDKLPEDMDQEYLRYSREICRWHHEKYDGRGYPDGLVGDAIPIAAQIVSLADCFDALTSPRVYKAAFSPEEAFRMIREGECGCFNEKLLACFSREFDRMKAITGGGASAGKAVPQSPRSGTASHGMR